MHEATHVYDGVGHSELMPPMVLTDSKLSSTIRSCCLTVVSSCSQVMELPDIHPIPPPAPFKDLIFQGQTPPHALYC